ncbi:hypothetical protein DAPPUDRAFT_115875 [Daphnia pulex]|uniref:Uncharacterized protein n=1 Tax=Daphnia pulex TaxID=6669 RepID=E9HMU0_DAPPU|nr:hypothetical protein DAPPUDRAFT_115875 [Daphnia pulex]|eukprot:EFX66947.1 hypothetical protein DAPPUDRAFT_115875 [Daphnia pulex]
MAINFENQPGPFDKFCKTSDNSEFPPLTSAKHLKRESAYFNAEEDANPDEWIKRLEVITIVVYEHIDRYIRTPRSSVHSVVVDEATLNNTSRSQPDNVNSIVGTSVSKSRSQVPKSAVIMNEIQQRLRQEIQLRRNVEEQLSKATATKTENTINSAKLFENRTLKSCHSRKKRQSVPKKIDANGNGAIQKKRVEFRGRNTEVTAEEPKETNDNFNKEYLSSFMLTRRSNSDFSRDKPTDVNLDFNPGQFYSSSFDGFNL